MLGRSVSPAIAARQATWITHERARHAVRELAARLCDQHIPVVPVKGLALAPWLYGDPAERPMLDADLLVSRANFDRANAIVRESGWRVWYASRELGELGFSIDDFPIELHAEIGRRGITSLTVDDLITRAALDDTTFDFPVLRIDNVDHLIVVATNVLKDMFVGASAHAAEDMARLWRGRTSPDDLVARCRQGSFATGMYLVARWMMDRGYDDFRSLVSALRPFHRPTYAAVVRSLAALRGRSLDTKKGAWPPSTVAAFLLACASCDDAATRRHCLATVTRRMARRAMRLAAEPGV